MVIYSKSQMFIAEHLSRKNPEFTMLVFSELTHRFDKCSSHSHRRLMLNLLVPWLYNIQLVDPNVVPTSTANNLSQTNVVHNNVNAFGLTTGMYTGSPAATHLILNNLFYLTCRFGAEFSAEFELLWSILALTWPKDNIKIITRYLYVMCSVSAYEMLPHAKRVCGFIARACAQRVLDELVTELEHMDTLSASVDRVENRLPFYAYTRPVFVSSGGGGGSGTGTPVPQTSSEKKKSSIYDQFNYGDSDDEHNESSDDDESNNSSEDSSDESTSGSSSNSEEKSDKSSKENTCAESNEDDDDLNYYDFGNVIESNSSASNNSTTTSSSIQQQFQLPLPANHQSYACRLNHLLYHIGHHHNQYQAASANQSPIYSPLNNYSHHIHYQHVANLTRSHISLLLLAELASTNGADLDWSSYMPLLLHYAVLYLDNPRALVCEHAKKLILSLLYVLCVQNELDSLNNILLDTSCYVIDNHSIVFNRIYTNTNCSSGGSGTSTSSMLSEYANNLARYNPNHCQYNYYFNVRVVAAGLNHTVSGGAGSAEVQANSPIGVNKTVPVRSPPPPPTSSSISQSHRLLSSTHSAPASPASANASSSNTAATAPKATKDSTEADEIAAAAHAKRQNKLEKACEHLKQLLAILAKSKCSPVWPHEQISAAQSSSKQPILTSVQILNEFVHHLKSFLKICSTAKQVSTISANSARSFLLNNGTRFMPSHHGRGGMGSSSSIMSNIDKAWALYALTAALKPPHQQPLNRHHATRSLQVYRALGGASVRCMSACASTAWLVQRLAETVAADPVEDLSAYAIEILITLKLNAGLLATEYTVAINSAADHPPKSSSSSSSIVK